MAASSAWTTLQFLWEYFTTDAEYLPNTTYYFLTGITVLKLFVKVMQQSVLSSGRSLLEVLVWSWLVLLHSVSFCSQIAYCQWDVGPREHEPNPALYNPLIPLTHKVSNITSVIELMLLEKLKAHYRSSINSEIVVCAGRVSFKDQSDGFGVDYQTTWLSLDSPTYWLNYFLLELKK